MGKGGRHVRTVERALGIVDGGVSLRDERDRERRKWEEEEAGGGEPE